MAPKKGMAIIQGHTSHPKAWFERFFFVRIDGESVEESYLHLFRREWNFTRVNRILPPTPADLFAKRDLLRSRPFFWNYFTVEIDLEPSLSPWTFRMAWNRSLMSCLLRGRESGLGKAREFPPITSWETFRCRNGTLVSPQWKGVEPARFPFPAAFLPTSLPVLLLISRWTKSRGGK
ncbi:hypothetical protein F2Q68_00021728 [Brassica cretica]|uniref:Uncharacterized protein n=1 Tax=Brassica cretica TaxID=69181 RepID=A0A8S9G1R8_BRACR|nr:hypothetical protein F2Q68_00021728 [Brassica cretica]